MDAQASGPNRYGWIWLALLCTFGFLHALTYALTNPVYESPDEPGHLGYIDRIAAGDGLPNQYDPKQFMAEGHQTPLYYLVAGNLLRISGGPIDVHLPQSNLKDPAPTFDHKPSPFKRSHDRNMFFALRILGCVFVGLTVLQTGRAARKILPIGHVYLVAPMLVAMLPQFAFIGASISNDGFAALIGSCATVAAADVCLQPHRRKTWLLFGVWIALAFLAKKNSLAYVPAALVLFTVIQIVGTTSTKTILRNALISVGAALVLSLPVLLRNLSLYDELLGTKMEMETMPNLAYTQDLGSPHFRFIFPDIVPRSFVSHFGWMAVEVKQRYVWPIVRAILGTAALGMIALFDRKRAAFAAFCLTAFLANVVGLVYYNLMFPQAQGRLLFPTLAPLFILCALGLFEISDRIRFRYKALAIIPIFIWLLWFDLLCFYTNQNFYAWFGPKLGF